MLKGITWGQFSIFLLVVAVVYYLYVLLTYYRAEALGWIRRKGGGDKNTQPVATGDRMDGAPGEPEPESAGSQAELFEEEVQGQDDAGFQQMQHAIGVIRQVIRQSIEHKLDRGNLLDHIKEVLREHRQLHKTQYAETINNFLIRVCSSELALELGEAELTGLWK